MTSHLPERPVMGGADTLAVLGRCRALAEVTPATLTLVAARCSRRSFAAGEVLIRQGEAGEALFILVSGSAQAAVLGGAGQRTPIGEFGAGDLLGEMALLSAAPCTAEVVARRAGEALVLSTRDFDELVAMSPELGVVVTDLVATSLAGGGGRGGSPVGGYRIRRCVGRGAMAIVYEAEEQSSRRVCALKMLSHRMIHEHGAMERFLREAKIQSELSHPNVTRYLDCFQAYKTWFLAMEFCDGADLSVLIASGYRANDAELRAILGQLAAGLAYMHERGVVHRDLKPHNVLVTRAGVLKLTDFGLARSGGATPQESPGSSAAVLGTPYYMAPEQMAGEQATPQSDVYALGCIALHLLTGKVPFQGRSLLEISQLKRAAALPPRRLLGRRRLWSGLSRRVYSLIRACLEPDPAERTVDLGALASWAQPLPPPALSRTPAAQTAGS